MTGVICYGAGRVYDLWLEGEREPLGVTAGHPIWSADRRAWVPAGALLAGERVQGVSGPVRVLRTEARGDEPVLTLEIDGGPRRWATTVRRGRNRGYLRSLSPRAELAEFLLHRSAVWESIGEYWNAVDAAACAAALDLECLRYAHRVASLVRKWSGALRAQGQIGDGFDYPEQPSGERRWPGVPWPDGMERGTTINWEDAGAVRVRV